MVEITKNEMEVLNLYRKNIFLEATILEIMKRLNKKSYQRVYEAVKKLEKSKIFRIDKFGKSSRVKLNLSEETIVYFSYLEEKEALSREIPNIRRIMDMKEFQEDIILITGSYAKGKQAKNSDIDLVVITKEKEVEKQKLLDRTTSLLTPEFHNIVINYEDFLGMLKAKEENFGKEIFKNHKILRNSGRYFHLLKEAIENGFRN